MAAASPLDEQMRSAGLQVLGPCERLSQWPGLLQASPLLEDFRPAEADMLGGLMLHVRAQPGQVLISEGDPSDWMMLLLRGTVDVGKRKVGAEGDREELGDNTRLAVLREGAVLGEMSMFDGEPRYASCWALSEVEAAVIDRAAVASLIRQQPAVGAKLLVKLTQLLAQRLRNTSQVWANPLGNVLVVAGAFSIWAGARTLRDLRAAPWLLALGPLVTGVASTLEDPANNIWSGGAVYLAMITVGVGLAARDLWHFKPTHPQISKAMSIVAWFATLYFFARFIFYVTHGPDSTLFKGYFGAGPLGLVTTVLLVAASFTMTTLSNDQLIRGLRERASRDHLTGLLNRGTFMDLAGAELKRLRASGSGAAVVLADLDHFKAVNDEHGHRAGDAALKAFAEACRESVRSTDLVGRYGGEEFVLFLPGATQKRAEDIALEISKRMATMEVPGGGAFPTVSYGVTSSTPATADLTFMIEVADAALYSAKAQGRNRIVGANRLEAATIADEARS